MARSTMSQSENTFVDPSLARGLRRQEERRIKEAMANANDPLRNPLGAAPRSWAGYARAYIRQCRQDYGPGNVYVCSWERKSFYLLLVHHSDQGVGFALGFFRRQQEFKRGDNGDTAEADLKGCVPIGFTAHFTERYIQSVPVQQAWMAKYIWELWSALRDEVTIGYSLGEVQPFWSKHGKLAIATADHLVFGEIQSREEYVFLKTIIRRDRLDPRNEEIWGAARESKSGVKFENG
jgi:hypothetical protein